MFDQNTRILILSPHTDDAELGCGATIAKFVSQGLDVFWVCFSTAEDSLPKSFPKDALEKEFKRPVYIDDEVTATVRVSSVNINRRVLKFLTTCETGGELVISGEAQIFVPVSKESERTS